jgi:hypothetical protein
MYSVSVVHCIQGLRPTVAIFSTDCGNTLASRTIATIAKNRRLMPQYGRLQVSPGPFRGSTPPTYERTSPFRFLRGGGCSGAMFWRCAGRHGSACKFMAVVPCTGAQGEVWLYINHAASCATRPAMAFLTQRLTRTAIGFS